jgi:restriction endonuclease S subunit
MIDWYNNLPDDWEETRLGWYADVFTGETLDSDYFNTENGPKVARIRHVSDGDSTTRYSGDIPDGYWISDGDILIGMDGPYFHVGVWEGGDALLNQRVACIPQDSVYNSQFLSYVLPKPMRILNDLTRSTTVKHLSVKDLRNVKIPLPPAQTIDSITDYLDRETGKIDKVIRKEKSYSNLLHEKKDTLVKSLITGGIDSETQRRDTNVDWIGEVPEHWDVVRTRFVAELHSGHTPDRSNEEYWEDTDIPWVTTSDIKPFREGRKRYLYEPEHKISELGMENSGAHLLPEGTVFLSRTASVGFSGIMGEPMATSQDFANWVCGDELIPEYLLYVFRSMDQEFNRLMQGSTHQTIYMPDIKSFKTPLPPLEEQREIVDHIETETERLWELIDRVEETIDLLEEKRQALITAAVTGQIDVTDERGEEQEPLA